MPRTLFFDCFAGASGDMLIGSLLDAGLDAERWQSDLARIALPEGSFTHTIRKVDKLGIRATKFTVYLDGHPADEPVAPHEHEHPHHEHRGLLEIEDLLDRSPLDARARDLAKLVFRNLAIAEGRVHGMPPERVHFHEVGAVDAIVDITGFAIALGMLAPDRVVVSPLVVGSGTVRCAHGVMPVPVPAVVELLKAARTPMRPSTLAGECLTPTGAAILTTMATEYAPGVAFERLEASGYGAGTRNQPEVPNVVRVLIGEA